LKTVRTKVLEGSNPSHSVIIKGKLLSIKRKEFIYSKTLKFLKLLRIYSKTKNDVIKITFLNKSKSLDSEEFGLFYFTSRKALKGKLESIHEIEINNFNLKSYKNLCTTLFHELVHLKQYINRQIIHVERKNKIYVYWKNKLIPNNFFPWEEEASKLEKMYWKNKKL
jgi:viroplasmin and RNaseH domain-containing protein